MLERRSSVRAGAMVIGGLLVAVGFVIGSAGPGTPQAHAQRAGVTYISPLPGIEVANGAFALVESEGVYFLVDTRGGAIPVRYKTNSLRELPGEALLRYPQ